MSIIIPAFHRSRYIIPGFKAIRTALLFQVSHVVFWHRYFYKVSQLEAAEEKRKILKQRAEKTTTDPDLVWDEGES